MTRRFFPRNNVLLDRVFLIDAMDPVSRVHYAYKERQISQSGVDVTVLFGFMRYLFALLSTRPPPTHCIVTFDAGGADFRKMMYAGYKGHREETPREIVESVPIIQKALNLLEIQWMCVHGIEADDVIATLSNRFASDTTRIYILSRDKVSIHQSFVGRQMFSVGFLSASARERGHDPWADDERPLRLLHRRNVCGRVWTGSKSLDRSARTSGRQRRQYPRGAQHRPQTRNAACFEIRPNREHI